MHPADEIRGIKSNLLENKRIVLAVTGSIAAVETVRLARELIRHGATVIPVMTPAATRIIHPDALWFATGKKPIVELTGDTEHVKFCGRVETPVDLVLIAPSTANTISKIALGIDDTAVTTFATTAIGSHRPIIIVPAMHLSMYDHNIVQENVTKLKEQGIEFVDPFFKDNKAKLASNERIVARVIHRIGPNQLKDKNVLIIGGSTEEAIDDVRCVTNKSSGETAIALAKNSFFQGAKVSLWYGQSKKTIPSFIPTQRFQSINHLKNLLDTETLISFDIIFVCAALSDYIPEKHVGKIDSTAETLTINCKKADKILPLIRKKASKSKIIGFKLAISKNNAIAKAQELLSSVPVNVVVANTITSLDSKKQKVWIISNSKDVTEYSGLKDDVALQILSFVKSVMV
ncbi:MAG: bifunctional phosphopantothenoylcysteine decarboxylase/phosphopantothenate--cysteine ligase CoaBC [Candidatus Thermoplasmatota archaeon]|nr:bifunctional phosphopantothenoylcysteine decarboxylase/phosphopantothenate--cysteine ligase CoaBC [Candidatus Thermoplasmatota archaeon]